MKVVNQRNEANMGSSKVTHGTMHMKSNTKGVPVTPVMVTPQKVKIGESRTVKGEMPK